MTRQEAIEKIEKYQCKRVGTVSERELEEALNMAIEALEQERCDDCISRQAAIDAVIYDGITALNADERKLLIEQIPSAKRHSAWVYCEDEAGHDGFRCEKCDTFYPWYYEYYHSADDFISDYNYCPHCGARMDGDAE